MYFRRKFWNIAYTFFNQEGNKYSKIWTHFAFMLIYIMYKCVNFDMIIFFNEVGVKYENIKLILQLNDYK